MRMSRPVRLDVCEEYRRHVSSAPLNGVAVWYQYRPSIQRRGTSPAVRSTPNALNRPTHRREALTTFVNLSNSDLPSLSARMEPSPGVTTTGRTVTDLRSLLRRLEASQGRTQGGGEPFEASTYAAASDVHDVASPLASTGRLRSSHEPAAREEPITAGGDATVSRGAPATGLTPTTTDSLDIASPRPIAVSVRRKVVPPLAPAADAAPGPTRPALGGGPVGGSSVPTRTGGDGGSTQNGPTGHGLGEWSIVSTSRRSSLTSAPPDARIPEGPPEGDLLSVHTPLAADAGKSRADVTTAASSGPRR